MKNVNAFFTQTFVGMQSTPSLKTKIPAFLPHTKSIRPFSHKIASWPLAEAASRQPPAQSSSSPGTKPHPPPCDSRPRTCKYTLAHSAASVLRPASCPPRRDSDGTWYEAVQPCHVFDHHFQKAMMIAHLTRCSLLFWSSIAPTPSSNVIMRPFPEL